jgi:hypothetical protein
MHDVFGLRARIRLGQTRCFHLPGVLDIGKPRAVARLPILKLSKIHLPYSYNYVNSSVVPSLVYNIPRENC